ncbi:MAG: polysaccharide biosynthesis tyrosine autokinase [Alistipes sp.]|nr:polysaccharide biosynthesis tyrosine autokinase [Alistipes sp.]
MTEYNENIERESASSLPRFTLYDFVQLILSNWYWFALSIIVCCLCAAFYLRRTAPVYQRSASVLVKDSRKGSAAEVVAFSDIMGGMGRRSVDNEVYILQSRRLMEEVVKRYDLGTNYSVSGRIRTTDIYGSTPLLVKFITAAPSDAGSFKYTIKKDGSVALGDFRDRLGEEQSFKTNAKVGDTITTPLGKIVFVPTPYVDQYTDKKVNVTKYPLNEITESYRKRLQCNITDKMASVINISMSDVVPKRAEDVINGIIDAYNADAINDKREISNLTEKFINERLLTLGQELNVADDEIASFKKENRIYSPHEEASLSAEEIARLKKESMSLEGSLEIAQYILDYVRNDASGSSLIPAATVSMSGASSALASQIDMYNTNVLNYQRLLAESSENSPVIMDLKAQISSVRGAIITSLESHIEGLKLQIANVSNEQRKADFRMTSSPTKEKELLSITRQQKVKEELYIYLLTKLEENALTGATAESNARVIDLAYGSNRPISPRSMMIYLMALVIGAIIPFVILYIMELLNTTVRSRREVEEALSAPFLGDIPRFEGKADYNVVVKENSRDVISEAFRILRTNINFMSVDRNMQVITLTSSIPHSGKTFISTNLAMTLAISGKKVLLMDLDLRRRTLSKQMGHRNDRRGLTSYLSGTISSLNDAISKTSLHDNLDMMYAGPQPPNPSEMLMSQRVDAMMAELRKMYDYIIIDNVPAMAVADAMIIDRFVDLTIYVVRQGNLDRRQLPDIEQLYREKKFNNMAIVLNGVSHNRSSYGYGYGYGYGYSYNYYYNEDKEYSVWQRRWHKLKGLFKKRH